MLERTRYSSRLLVTISRILSSPRWILPLVAAQRCSISVLADSELKTDKRKMLPFTRAVLTHLFQDLLGEEADLLQRIQSWHTIRIHSSPMLQLNELEWGRYPISFLGLSRGKYHDIGEQNQNKIEIVKQLEPWPRLHFFGIKIR